MVERKPSRMRIGLQIDPNPPLDHPFVYSDLPTVAEVLLSAKLDARFQDILNDPNNNPLSIDEMKKLIVPAEEEIYQLECAARDPETWNIDEEKARSIFLIVDFSAPGKYRYPKKHDYYEKYDYAWGMDRYRSDAAARAGILIAGQQTGHDLSAFAKVNLLHHTNKELVALLPAARESIKQSGLRFLYLGNTEESESVRKVVEDPSSFIPAEDVDIVNEKIKNTFDQVIALKNYLQDFPNLKPGSKVLFVCHSPQVMRSLRIIEKQQAIPPGVTLSVLPLPIPTLGMKEYTEMEIKGMLGNVMTGTGSTTPCHYEIFGKYK